MRFELRVGFGDLRIDEFQEAVDVFFEGEGLNFQADRLRFQLRFFLRERERFVGELFERGDGGFVFLRGVDQELTFDRDGEILKFGVFFFLETFDDVFQFGGRVGVVPFFRVKKRLETELVDGFFRRDGEFAVEKFLEQFFRFFGVLRVRFRFVFFLFERVGDDERDELHFERFFFNGLGTRFVGEDFVGEFENRFVEGAGRLRRGQEGARFDFDGEDLEFFFGTSEHFVGQRVDFRRRVVFARVENLKLQLISFDEFFGRFRVFQRFVDELIQRFDGFRIDVGAARQRDDFQLRRAIFLFGGQVFRGQNLVGDFKIGFRKRVDDLIKFFLRFRLRKFFLKGVDEGEKLVDRRVFRRFEDRFIERRRGGRGVFAHNSVEGKGGRLSGGEFLGENGRRFQREGAGDSED